MPDDVGHQLFLPRSVLVDENAALPDGGVPRERALDFAELDPHALDLDLIVTATPERERAILAKQPQIARAVHARARLPRKGIRPERFVRLGFPVEVTPRQARSAHPDLTDRAHGNGLPVRIENIDSGVGNRTAQGHQSLAIQTSRERVDGDDSRGLGLPVHVDHLSLAELRHQSAYELEGERLAGRENQTQANSPGGPPAAARRAGRARPTRHASRMERDRGSSHRKPLDFLQQEHRVDHLLRRGDDAASAVGQGNEQLPHGRGEPERGGVQVNVGASDRESLSHGLDVVPEPAVGQDHSLGRTRGTGRVHDVGRILRPRAGFRVGGLPERNGGPVRVDPHDGKPSLRQPTDEAILREKNGRLGVVEHRGQARSRLVRSQRKPRASRLENGEHGHGKIDRSVQADGHDRLGAHTEAPEMARELVRPLIELAVAESSVTVGDGDLVVAAGGDGLEETGHGYRLGIRAARLAGSSRRWPLAPPRSESAIEGISAGGFCPEQLRRLITELDCSRSSDLSMPFPCCPIGHPDRVGSFGSQFYPTRLDTLVRMKASTWRREGVKTMRTSIEIPEEVWTAAKIRSAQLKTNLQDVIAEALRDHGLKPKKGARKDGM